MTHNETKLPHWAQETIRQLRRQVSELRAAHAILNEREWFTLWTQQKEPRMLFWIDRDNPRPACSLGVGDVLIVGRAKT